MKRSFAAFIMTYERASIITKMIDALMQQTVPPQKILIVDNSESDDTRHVITALQNPVLAYLRVGFNSGPAGAAKFGLEQLASEGFQWIFWGDDDDPPVFVDTFERLFEMIDKQSISPGLVGCVGQAFNRTWGETRRVPDSVLRENDFVSVDSIAGNQCLLVNADVVRAGILPDEKLFFGLEELDFCLRIKQADFKLLVSSSLFIDARAKYDRSNFKRPVYTRKSAARLYREYYSSRNLLFILKRNKLWIAFIYQIMKSLLKTIYGFRFGKDYGFNNLKYIARGLFDGIFNNFRILNR